MSIKNIPIYIIILIILFIIYSFYKEYTKNKTEIKIMCIGDSITFGHKTPGSYRKFLYNNLIKKGYNIKMIGTKNKKIEKYYYNKNISKKFFLYQDNNEGYNGYTICSFGRRKGILELLKKNKCLKLNPDIIILMIGTNNIMENYDYDLTINDFISLIKYILNNISENSMLFVSTILDLDPNHKYNYFWFDNYRKENINDFDVKNMVDNYVIRYNNKIKEIIKDFENRGYNIKIEDGNKVIKNFDKLMIEGVHPNNDGYKKLGDFWAEIIDKYLYENFNKF